MGWILRTFVSCSRPLPGPAPGATVYAPRPDADGTPLAGNTLELSFPARRAPEIDLREHEHVPPKFCLAPSAQAAEPIPMVGIGFRRTQQFLAMAVFLRAHAAYEPHFCGACFLGVP